MCVYTTGDQYISGDLHVSGTGYFHHDLHVSGTGYFASDVFISGGSGDNRLFVGTGETAFCVNADGSVGVGTGACENPVGTFNVSGSAYLEKAYITGADGNWMQLTGGAGSSSSSDGVNEAYVWFVR